MKRLIALTGKYGSGKDTIANYLTKDHKFARLVFSDELKHRTSLLTNIDLKILQGNTKKNRIKRESKKDKIFRLTGRQWLTVLGDGIRRHVDEDYWLDIVMEKKDQFNRVVITDARYNNEFERIKEENGILIYVSNNQITETVSERIFDFKNSKYIDYVINNHGSKKELYGNVREMLGYIEFKDEVDSGSM